jgi:hypothetical protein
MSEQQSYVSNWFVYVIKVGLSIISVPNEVELGLAAQIGALRVVLLVGAKGEVAGRSGASGALIYFSVGIPQLNGNISLQLVFESDSL